MIWLYAVESSIDIGRDFSIYLAVKNVAFETRWFIEAPESFGIGKFQWRRSVRGVNVG
jgi:hypothetical protein